ncbi:MAG: acyl CoA:acetate/3-ketoacid CoA transferase [Anaerolineaceae bacterium]|nr:acyl CoA:acetate/3-ketoacid CoA transferase [Anaerolineaceae bacterium]
MSPSKLVTLEQAAALIADEAIVTVSSSSGLGCPDAMLKAIGQRFEASGTPRNLTTLHPIAAGDMYGITGIDYLAQPGLLRRIVAGSYPSGPSSMPSPKIWQMINNNAIEAYNFPSGILFHMHREAAAGRPGVLTKVGWDTVVDPRHRGGRMNDATTEDLVEVVDFDGQEWLYFRAIAPDVALIRATTADEFGNLSYEHEGAYLGALDQALAARNNGGIVIAQVKRMTAGGTLNPQAVRVPGTLVDYVVLDPDQMQTTQTLYEPAISGEVRRPLDGFEPVEWSVQKIIARRAALELRSGESVNLGFGISALVPYILLEEGLHGAVTWVIEQGAVGGLPLLDFQFGCATNAQAIVASPDQFTYFQGGGFDRSLLSFMQVDQHGSVNVSRLGAKPHVTAGIGGFIDITANARSIVFSGFFTAGGLELDVVDGQLRIVTEGRFPKFVPQAEEITYSGRRGVELGQNVTYVTERCVIKLLPQGLTVTEIAPDVDLNRDVLGQAGIDLRVSDDLQLMDARLFRPQLLDLTLPAKGKRH